MTSHVLWVAMSSNYDGWLWCITMTDRICGHYDSYNAELLRQDTMAGQ